MTGFFKKLLGKKEENAKPESDTGSWTEHEVSVDVNDNAEEQEVSQEAVDSQDAQQSISKESVSKEPLSQQAKPEKVKLEAEPASSIVQSENTPTTKVDISKETQQLSETQPMETYPPKALPGFDQNDNEKNIAPLNIALLDTADLKYATNQMEPPKVVDPMDEITAQIQSELAAERTEKEKKAKLEELLEVTNKLRRPDFDEDFDV